jgi:hypothetical protein
VEELGRAKKVRRLSLLTVTRTFSNWHKYVGRFKNILAFVAATGFSMNLYSILEYLELLLLLAVTTATILVLAVAFVLLHEGIRRVVLWAKTGDMRRPGLRAIDDWIRRPGGQSALHFPKISNGLITKKRFRFQLTR